MHALVPAEYVIVYLVHIKSNCLIYFVNFSTNCKCCQSMQLS